MTANRTILNLVAGKAQGATQDTWREVVNPATGVAVARSPESAPEDVHAAFAAAENAFPEWKRMTAVQRSDVMTSVAVRLRSDVDEIASLITAEAGKPVAEARGEVLNAARIIDFYAGWGTRLGGSTLPSVRPGVKGRTVREPVGPLGLITPWNFPVNLAAVKLGPALMAGNTVVLKPSSAAPGPTAALAQLFADSGLPEGVLNVVHGSGEAIGDAMVAADPCRGVSFTGSTAVGQHVAILSAQRGIRALCELGGSNPLVVDSSADLPLAVQLGIEGAFRFAGQKCTATRRIIVVGSIWDQFVDAFIGATADLAIGDPADAGTFVGPLISAAARARVSDQVAAAASAGAEILIGGTFADGAALASGSYYGPTVLRVEDSSHAGAEEIFGPVVFVMPAENLDIAVREANRTVYGLTASICTSDLEAASRFIEQCEAGVVGVNVATAGIDFHTPFGGRRASGIGGYREQGDAAMEFYTEAKSISIKWSGELL